MPKHQLDFSKPPVLPETLEESHALILKLWGVIAELQAWKENLEEQLKTGSDNSSAPPSQDSPKKRAERKRKPATGRKKGAQAGHQKHERALLPEDKVNTIKRYYPDTQCACGGVVRLDGYRRHQVFDLPEVHYTVTEFQRYTGQCQCCGQRHTAQLPQSVPKGQMGPGLIAWINLLNGRYHLTLRQIEDLLSEQWNLQFSLGAISQSQEKLNDWLLPVYHQIGEVVRQADLGYVDETRHYRNRSTYWLWSLSTPQAAYFLIHYSRGKGAAKELLGSFDGILVTDRHGAYNDYAADKHQYCWAHIIRNLEKIAQRHGRAGKDGQKLLRLARLIVRNGKRWQHSDYQSLHYRQRLQKLRTTFEKQLQQTALIHGKNKTGNSCRKLLKDSPRLWTFLAHPGVAMTNNAAERSLRPYVIWRKISFFSQSHRGTQYRAMILSVIETCRRLDINLYQTLRTICAQGIEQGLVTFRLPIPEQKVLSGVVAS